MGGILKKWTGVTMAEQGMWWVEDGQQQMQVGLTV
jgi:hypothetical protein